MKGVFLPLIVLLAASMPSANAQVTYTFVGATSSWSAAGSWSPTGVPDDGDTAIISSGNPTLDENVTVSRIEMSGGSLDGNGSVTVTDSLIWTGGTLNGRNFADSAAVYIASGAGMHILGSDVKTLRGRDIISSGATLWEGDGNISVAWPTIWRNGIGATTTIAAEAQLTRTNGTLDWINDGEIRRTGNSGTTFVYYPFGAIVNNGLFVVEQGTLQLANGISAFATGGDGTFEVKAGATLQLIQADYVFGEGSTVTGDGTLEVYGDDVRFGSASSNGTVAALGGSLRFTDVSRSTTLSDVTLSGGAIGGAAEIDINGTLTWTAGSLGDRNGGAGIINLKGPSNLSGDAEKRFANGTYNNFGTMTWTGTGNMNAHIGGTFVNHPEGTIDIQTDAAWTRSNGSLTFTNQGLIKKTAGTGTTVVSLPFAPFNNDGEIRVEIGNLAMNLQSSCVDTGSYYVAEGAGLSFASHTRTFQDGVMFSGNGTVSFGGATIVNNGATFSPGSSYGTLNIGGNLSGPIAGSTFNIEIGGYEPGVDHDQIHVAQRADLSGTLNVTFADSFVPADGDRFLIVAADSGSTGTFSVENFPDGLQAFVYESELGAELVIGTNVALESTDSLPTEYALSAPWPNPFSDTATLAFELPESERVEIVVYNLLGREVLELLDSDQPAGRHSISLDASRLPTGTYFVRMTAARYSETRSIVLLR